MTTFVLLQINLFVMRTFETIGFFCFGVAPRPVMQICADNKEDIFSTKRTFLFFNREYNGTELRKQSTRN